MPSCANLNQVHHYQRTILAPRRRHEAVLRKHRVAAIACACPFSNPVIHTQYRASEAASRCCWLTRPLAMSGDQADDVLMDLLWEVDLPLHGTSLFAPAPLPSLVDPFDVEWAEVLAIPDAVEPDASRPIETAAVPPRAWPHAQYVRPTRGRLTTRHRIQTLKVEVERLQAALEAAREQSKQAGLPKRLGVQTTSSSSLAEGMWQPIAARQQQWREQAEAENTRLRTLVFAQERHLHNVHRLLGRQPHRHVSTDGDASGLIEMGTHLIAYVLHLVVLMTGSGRGS